MASEESEVIRFKREERACSKCEWYEHYYHHNEHYGACKRRAPTLAPGEPLGNQWPTLHKNSWCGEFQVRAESEE